MSDTPSSIKLVLPGKECDFPVKNLWSAFRRVEVMKHLQNEVRYIARKDAWNDLGFTRHKIKELLDIPGAETKIYGVEKWAMVLVLFRSRIFSWDELKRTYPYPWYTGTQWEHLTAHSFTVHDIADIDSMIQNIRRLLRVDDEKDNIDRQSQLKSLPVGFQLKEDQDFRVDRKMVVGSGGNATVYGAWYPKNSAEMNAAFKEIRSKPDVAMNEQITELHYMLMTQHPNVMMLYGWAEISPNRMGLVMPKRDYNLRDVLWNPLNHIGASYLDDDPTKYIAIALAIARGIKELHRIDIEPEENSFMKPEILHRDIKPENVLISGCFETIEISDFGSSKANHVQSTARTPYRCTMDYEAPELRNTSAIYTTKCDIWSYGLILAQMVYRMEMESTMEIYEMLRLLKPDEPERPLKFPKPKATDLQDISAKIINVAEECLHLDYSKRATAADCVSILEDKLGEPMEQG